MVPDAVPTLSLRAPADLLAAVPYLFGFHPADSVVLVGLDDRRVAFQARADLVTPAAPVAEQLAEVLVRQGLRQALIIGYGPAARADPMVRALIAELARAGVVTREALRVAGGRYWSYTCTVPECCPPDGNPYTLDASAVAAQATVAGMVALPSRDALRERFAPVEGAERESMARATQRADLRAREIVAAALDAAASSTGGPAQGSSPLLGPAEAAREQGEAAVRAARQQGEAAVRAARERFASAGRVALREALAVHRAGGTLSDDAVAWLSVLLVHLPVRDHAWASITGDLRPHLALWTDLTRRAEPHLRAAPAALLAFAAWRAGEGATSTIALDIATQADPEYPMAKLLNTVIAHGIAPQHWPRIGADLPRRRQLRRRYP
jgi:Domain of unknown function (DUF4192)